MQTAEIYYKSDIFVDILTCLRYLLSHRHDLTPKVSFQANFPAKMSVLPQNLTLARGRFALFAVLAGKLAWKL